MTTTADFETGQHRVSVRLGRGDGSFQALEEFGVDSFPRSIALGDFNGDGWPDLATANLGPVGAGTVSILLNNTAASGVVNELVTFAPLPATVAFSLDPAGCPAEFAGTFRFEARLTNISESPLTGLAVIVTTLTNGNLLQNADGGPQGVGARLTVPQDGALSDGVLSPAEFVDVPFVICLQERAPFTFEVDVVGRVQ